VSTCDCRTIGDRLPSGASGSPVSGPRGDRLRILLLVRALGLGGAERQIVNLAIGLARRGHKVTVATFYSCGAFENLLSGGNPDRLRLEKRGRWDIIGFLRRFVRALAGERPDIVYSFLPMANLVAITARAVVRTRPALVWGVRGTPIDLARYSALERASTRIEQLLSRTPDLIIANSRAGADWVSEWPSGVKQLAMVVNGIDTDAFRPASAHQRAAARASFGCSPGTVVVAVVARFDPMKDHVGFLRALAIAARVAPDFRALIVGEGSDAAAAELRVTATALGLANRVIWAAPQREIEQIYHAADMLCLSSAFGEGFPNVVAEAMASGLRVVATSVGDCASLIGDAGRVVPPGAPELLAHALLDCREAVLKNGVIDMAARQRIVRHFGIEAMVSATENLLRQAVSARSRPAIAAGRCLG
jgi:glycosyltransferase involved in cell wall biosynthesis